MTRMPPLPNVDASAPVRHRSLVCALLPLVHDLARHRPARYWGDFLLSICVFWASWAGLALRSCGTDAVALSLYLVALFSLYRATCFMHEIVHLPQSTLPGFRWCWDLLCGIPLLLPAFLYASHLDHHASSSYGTRNDPEYLPGLHASWSHMATLLLGTVLTPPALWLRFAVLAPLACCLPGLRQQVDARFSSVSLHLHYRGEAACWRGSRRQLRTTEWLATLWAWGLVALVASDTLALHQGMRFLAVVLGVLLVNMVRTALTHHYRSDGTPMTRAQQVADSVTWTRGGLLTELLAPVGLRYHALHHLFPYLPYHALATAHARLMAAEGPAARSYQATAMPRTPDAPRPHPGNLRP